MNFLLDLLKGQQGHCTDEDEDEEPLKCLTWELSHWFEIEMKTFIFVLGNALSFMIPLASWNLTFPTRYYIYRNAIWIGKPPHLVLFTVFRA